VQEPSYSQIQTLLASNDSTDLLNGLALAGREAATAGREGRDRLCEMILPLFYIDPLDHPEHLPVIEEAIATVAGLGEDVIPVLIQNMEAGDVKAQMAMAQTLGRMGPRAIDPLLIEYRSGCPDPSCRSFLLYALGKVKSPQILKAAPLAAEAAGSPDLELRDTATRAIGKFAESIPPGEMPEDVRDAFISQLQARLTDASPGIRSKAVRSLGKLARHGHLTQDQRDELRVALQRIVGEDVSFDWDRAYVVRKEAREAMAYV
jgi:hypothetical protein